MAVCPCHFQVISRAAGTGKAGIRALPDETVLRGFSCRFSLERGKGNTRENEG